jgi:AraC-like DNA-binding protein
LDAIAERIVDQLSSSRVTVKKIASDLGTNKRTISKRLTEHGTSVDQLIDDIRKDLAMRYLDYGSVKVKELGFLLGFSTQARFSAAFKRWTGKTLGETRALS